MLTAQMHRGNRESVREGSYGRFLYNFYRTYDPNTGRYLEADPIGQVGGLNVYEYAFSDPLNMIDPRGSSTLGVRATDVRRAFRHYEPFARGERASRMAFFTDSASWPSTSRTTCQP